MTTQTQPPPTTAPCQRTQPTPTTRAALEALIAAQGHELRLVRTIIDIDAAPGVRLSSYDTYRACATQSETRTIALSRGQSAIVDEDDYERLNRHKWYCTSGGYAARSVWSKPRRIVYMHREILGLDENTEVDHWNRNTLDNRKANLRRCTSSQNKRNTRHINKLGFKGVQRSHRRFSAHIWLNARHVYLGGYDTAVEAAFAYDTAALEQFGAFALLNVPRPSLTPCRSFHAFVRDIRQMRGMPRYRCRKCGASVDEDAEGMDVDARLLVACQEPTWVSYQWEGDGKEDL